MGLDHELLHAVNEVVDFRHHQAPRDDGLQQVEGRGFAPGGLHIPKRPLQQEAQLLIAGLHRDQECCSARAVHGANLHHCLLIAAVLPHLSEAPLNSAKLFYRNQDLQMLSCTLSRLP